MGTLTEPSPRRTCIRKSRGLIIKCRWGCKHKRITRDVFFLTIHDSNVDHPETTKRPPKRPPKSHQDTTKDRSVAKLLQPRTGGCRTTEPQTLNPTALRSPILHRYKDMSESMRITTARAACAEVSLFSGLKP